MELSFQLNDAAVKKTFASLERSLSSYKKPFQKAGKDLVTFYGEEVFDSQGEAGSGRWRKLAASTLMARERRSGYYAQRPVATGKALIWTGRLQKGIKDEPSDKQLRIYNDVPYFKYHQKAGGRPPQREMLVINSKVITTVSGHIFDYLESAIES